MTPTHDTCEDIPRILRANDILTEAMSTLVRTLRAYASLPSHRLKASGSVRRIMSQVAVLAERALADACSSAPSATDVLVTPACTPDPPLYVKLNLPHLSQRKANYSTRDGYTYCFDCLVYVGDRRKHDALHRRIDMLTNIDKLFETVSLLWGSDA